MKLIHSIFVTTLFLGATPFALAQTTGIEETAREALREVDLDQLWTPGQITVSGPPVALPAGVSYVRVSNAHFSMRFVIVPGRDPRLSAFSWEGRKDQIRKRGNKQFRAEEITFRQRARAILSHFSATQFADGEWVDRHHARVGSQTAYQNGTLATWFDTRVNGVPDIGGNAEVEFDGEDASVIGITVPISTKPYEPRGDLIGTEEAKRIAFEKVSSELRRTMSAEYADSIIAKMQEAQTSWTANLCYNSIGGQFDEGSAEYIGVDKPKPILYEVKMGPVSVPIHAITGKALRGGVSTAALGPSNIRKKGPATPGKLTEKSSNLAPATVALGLAVVVGYLARRKRRI